MKIFENTSKLILARLTTGQFVETKYHTTEVGNGSGRYRIKTLVEFASTPDEIFDFTLANGNVAELQHDSIINIRQGGAVDSGNLENILEAACNQAHTVDFDGITADYLDPLNPFTSVSFVMPANAPCRKWTLNGATIDFKSGEATVLNSGSTDFEVDLSGSSEIKLGLIKNQVNANTASAVTSTIELASTTGLAVGQMISSAFANKSDGATYGGIPDAKARIDAFFGGDFNRVQAINGNTITTEYPFLPDVTLTVSNTIPRGAFICNNTFDNKGLHYIGTGTFTVKNGKVSNSRGWCLIGLTDYTQSANLIIENVDLSEAGLDFVYAVCDNITAKNYSFITQYDIAKQGWTINAKGNIYLENPVHKRNNRDGEVNWGVDNQFLNPTPANTESVGFKSLTVISPDFDGQQDWAALGFIQGDEADAFPFGQAIHGIFPETGRDDPFFGSALISGGTIRNYERNFFSDGTTKVTWNYNSLTFNSVDMEATPVKFAVSDTVNSFLPPVNVINSRVEFTTNNTIAGARGVFTNCDLTPNVKDKGDARTYCSFNDAELHGGTIRENPDNNYYFEFLNDKWIAKDVGIYRRTTNWVRFDPDDGRYKGEDMSFILLDADLDVEDYLDITQWFDPPNALFPSCSFSVEGQSVTGRLGEGDAASTHEWIYRYKAREENSAPFDSNGAHSAYPPLGSTVEGIQDGLISKVSAVDTELTNNPSGAGAAIINVTTSGLSFTLAVGDFAVLPPLADGTVRFTEIIAINATDIDVDQNIPETIPLGDEIVFFQTTKVV